MVNGARRHILRNQKALLTLHQSDNVAEGTQVKVDEALQFKDGSFDVFVNYEIRIRMKRQRTPSLQTKNF